MGLGNRVGVILFKGVAEDHRFHCWRRVRGNFWLRAKNKLFEKLILKIQSQIAKNSEKTGRPILIL